MVIDNNYTYYGDYVVVMVFGNSVTSNNLLLHGLQRAGLPWPSLSPRVFSNSCPLSRWCHPTISSSAVPFFSFLHSFPAFGSFPMSQFVTSGGQSIEASAPAPALWMDIWAWFPVELTGLISLLCKELPRVFSSTTIQKYQFFSTQPSL